MQGAPQGGLSLDPGLVFDLRSSCTDALDPSYATHPSN